MKWEEEDRDPLHAVQINKNDTRYYLAQFAVIRKKGPVGGGRAGLGAWQ